MDRLELAARNLRQMPVPFGYVHLERGGDERREHCVIGSIEVLLGMFAGAPITWGSWLSAFLAPAVIGNAIGGVIFVTGLKGAQARSRR